MKEPHITIGQAAEATGATPKAIRLYEQRGLLPVAPRTAAGYRTYGAADIELIRFIRRSRTLGLHLDDISRVLDLRANGDRLCAAVADLLDERLADIDRAMADLDALRHTLLNARSQAGADPIGDTRAAVCPVIETTTTR